MASGRMILSCRQHCGMGYLSRSAPELGRGPVLLPGGSAHCPKDTATADDLVSFAGIHSAYQKADLISGFCLIFSLGGSTSKLQCNDFLHLRWRLEGPDHTRISVHFTYALRHFSPYPHRWWCCCSSYQIPDPWTSTPDWKSNLSDAQALYPQPVVRRLSFRELEWTRQRLGTPVGD